jgi:hypothetical protein
MAATARITSVDRADARLVLDAAANYDVGGEPMRAKEATWREPATVLTLAAGKRASRIVAQGSRVGRPPSVSTDDELTLAPSGGCGSLDTCSVTPADRPDLSARGAYWADNRLHTEGDGGHDLSPAWDS